MNQILEMLQSFGLTLTIDENSSPVLLLALSTLIFSSVALVCTLNIIMYLGILYLSKQDFILGYLSKYVLLQKLFNLYKGTTMLFLIIEFGLLLFNISSIVWYNYKVLHILM
jgi:hypothetical protein